MIVVTDFVFVQRRLQISCCLTSVSSIFVITSYCSILLVLWCCIVDWVDNNALKLQMKELSRFVLVVVMWWNLNRSFGYLVQADHFAVCLLVDWWFQRHRYLDRKAHSFDTNAWSRARGAGDFNLSWSQSLDHQRWSVDHLSSLGWSQHRLDRVDTDRTTRFVLACYLTIQGRHDLHCVTEFA